MSSSAATHADATTSQRRRGFPRQTGQVAPASRIYLALAGLICSASALSGPASTAAAVVTGVTNVQIVQRLTGPEQTGHVAIGGSDLGHMVNYAGKTYFLFGDTFSGDTPADGEFWRSNAMAYTDDASPADGVTLDGWITNSAGNAREVIASGRTNPITEIPTGAISVGGRIYAWFMAVNWWGPPGEWTNNYAGLASWQQGQSRFSVISDFSFPADSNFGMVAASLRDDLTGGIDDHVYLWGTPAGRLGGVKLARVAPESIADVSAYEYFSGVVAGQPTWSPTEYAVPLIVEPTVGEMSVVYNPGLESWTMLYLNHDEYAIEFRQAAEPWGPWSDPITVVTGQQFPGLYGSYMNPLYLADGGRTVYFTMSLWEPYDVYLMKATFEAAAPGPSADFNGDGRVDAADLARWQAAAGRFDWADGNDDGITDGADLILWQRQYGSGTTQFVAHAAVPEPATWALAALAATVATQRRRGTPGVESRAKTPK